MFKKVTLEELRAKSQQLTAYLELLIDDLLERLYEDLDASNSKGNKVLLFEDSCFKHLLLLYIKFKIRTYNLEHVCE